MSRLNRWPRNYRDLVQCILALAAIGSLIYAGRAVQIQNEMAQIERTPVVYVACSIANNSLLKPPEGPFLNPVFDFSAVWSAFPNMKSVNGQAVALFPPTAVEHCLVHNYGRLTVEGLRLSIVARLLRSHLAPQKCSSPHCQYDYGKDAAVEVYALLPAPVMDVSPFTIEPGGVRAYNVSDIYRQQLEFEFASTAQAVVPPDPSPTTVPVVVGSSESSNILPPAADCPPRGMPTANLHLPRTLRC